MNRAEVRLRDLGNGTQTGSIYKEICSLESSLVLAYAPLVKICNHCLGGASCQSNILE